METIGGYMIYLFIVIRVIYNFIRLNFIKLFFYKRFIFNPVQFISCNSTIDVRGKKSKILLKGRVSARKNFTIAVRNGELIIGENVFFNAGCSITCHDRISIGDNCLFGPNVSFFDHDHIYGLDKIINREGFIKAPIELGSNIFVGANSLILRGTKIGDNSVIAAGTIVKGSIPPNSLVYNNRELTVKSLL